MKQLFFKNCSFLFTCILLAGALSCNEGAEDSAVETDTTMTTSDNMDMGKMAMANLSGTVPDTTVSGTARFETQADGQVKMMLDITVPQKANSSVAVHIHEHGDCGDMGKNAHGHWNPTGEAHGKWGEGQFHSGDIGNIDLDSEGKGTAELITNRWTIGGDTTSNVLNKAIIIHSGKDDYKSQPAGDAGSRIGCGVIQAGGNY